MLGNPQKLRNIQWRISRTFNADALLKVRQPFILSKTNFHNFQRDQKWAFACLVAPRQEGKDDMYGTDWQQFPALILPHFVCVWKNPFTFEKPGMRLELSFQLKQHTSGMLSKAERLKGSWGACRWLSRALDPCLRRQSPVQGGRWKPTCCRGKPAK